MLSIITPTLNRANSLEAAIQSVYAQGIDDLEFIIMDGGSTDGTRELVARYPQIRFYSEPDNGLYEAINKGIRLAKGQMIGWLNSDDLYPAGALRAALEALKEHKDWAAVFGDAEVTSLEKNQKTVLIPAFRQENFLRKVASDSFSINAGLIRHEVFSLLNDFDLTYKIASDRDFMFRLGLAGISFGTIERTLYIYQMSSTSLTFSKNLNGKINGDLEEMQMAAKFLQNCNDAEKKQICITWHSRASADAAMLSLLDGNRDAYNKIKIQGQLVDQANWQRYYTRALFMHYVRKTFPPQMRARLSKLKKRLGYYSDVVD